MVTAFMMDSPLSIEPRMETTSHLMYECNQRGHTVFFLEPHDLYVRAGQVVARMKNVSAPPGLSMIKYWEQVCRSLAGEEIVFETISDLDILFLRKDPPLNHQVMQFLAPVANQVFMINSPTGQMAANSKLYLLNFPGIIPETHVSRDPSRLLKVINDFGGEMVLKPLARSGGEGVIKVSLKDRDNLNSLIHYYVRSSEPYYQRESVMVQEFLHEVKRKGDVRIMLLDGEIIGAMGRVPAADDFRTNVHAGATAVKHEITPAERRVCAAIADRLRADGLYFVGLDMIGDKLVEVNVVSPGGIPRINALDGVRLEIQVMDFAEKRARQLKRPAREQAV